MMMVMMIIIKRNYLNRPRTRKLSESESDDEDHHHIYIHTQLHIDWFNESKGVKHKFKHDFKLYSNYDDAKNNRNEWKYCNLNYPGIGFPRDCGPVEYTTYTFIFD